MRFTNKRNLCVVAVCNPLEHIFHSEKFDHPLCVGNKGVGKQPEFDFGSVHILEEGTKVWVWGNNSIQGKRIVDLLIVL